jgi:predicted dehydrogenase
MWLGETPMVYYTEDRVHPQTPDIRKRYGRPGWLRCEQFGAGMITGWGVHHFDIANWAMDWGQTGPLTVEAKAQFPLAGSLWDVHSSYDITATFPGDVVMHVSDKLPNGLKFVGENGKWIFVSRGAVRATASDPITPGVTLKALDASDPKILQYEFKGSDVRLHASPKDDHHFDWITAIKNKGETVAPAEAGHRACSISLVCHTAMKLGRKLNWDPIKERFAEDEANSMPMMSRPQRAPYGTNAVLEKAGIKI